MNLKINKNNWKEFEINDVFDICRGKRLVELDQIDGGIAYISSSKKNNGVDNYILPPEYMQIYHNAITLSNSGSVGYCFYHPYKFVASDHCTVISIKDKKIELNNCIALFLKPIIEAMKSKYNFAREINNDRLEKEKILLPNKNDNPDWDYMEKYIKNLSEKIKFDKGNIFNNSIFKNKVDLNLTNWGEFTIKDVFDPIQKGERLTVVDRNIGDVPLLTASAVDNGISSFIDEEAFKDKKKLFENKITIDMFCNVFYQDFKYFSDDNIHTMLFKNKKYEKYYGNKYINLFLVSILKQLSKKYGYGRQVRLKRIENEIIKLPAKESGEIDFEFMEKYIKSLPYSAEI